MFTKKYFPFILPAVAAILFVGCLPNTITEPAKPQTIVLQYSGGKEIGRWYLDDPPDFNKSSFVSFRSGDSVIRVSGDVKVITMKPVK